MSEYVEIDTDTLESFKEEFQRGVGISPHIAANFMVWSMNGGPLPEGAVERFEAAIGQVQKELEDEGYRILTQTVVDNV